MNYVGGPIAWRLPIAAQILPALLISVVLFGLPETPRWLIEQGRIDDAVKVMCQVYGSPPDDEYIVVEKAAILETLELERQNPFRWAHVFKQDRLQTGRRVLLAIAALSFNQVILPDIYHECKICLRDLVVRNKCRRFLYWYGSGGQRGPFEEHSARCWGLYQSSLCRRIFGACSIPGPHRSQEANE